MTVLDESQIAAHIRDIEVLGYTRIPNFLPVEQVKELTIKVEQLAEKMKGSFYPGFSDYNKTDETVFNLQNKDKIFTDILGYPSLEKIIMHFLNDEYYRELPPDHPNYILSETLARCSGDELRLHIDSWMPAPGPRTWMMQVVFALTDRDIEDGCTALVPGSHVRGEYTDRGFQTLSAAPVKPGDVVIWDSRLWHGAFKRQKDKKSWVIVSTLQRWWVKPRFDSVRGLPDEIYANLSDRQRVLLGFCSVPPHDEIEHTSPRYGYEALEGGRRK